MEKVKIKDLKIGETLYFRNNGEFFPVEVVKIVQGGKGPKVHFIDREGKPGKRLWSDLYIDLGEGKEGTGRGKNVGE